MVDGFIRLPSDSTGKSLDTRSFSTGNTATTETVHREVIIIGDVSSVNTVAVVTTSEGLQVRSTMGANPWSSAPGFNVPMVSASSGLVQLSGTPTVAVSSSALVPVNIVTSSGAYVPVTTGTGLLVLSTAATSPWSSAPGFNIPIVSVSSGLVQISGGLSSGIITLSSVHTITATAATNPWSSAPSFNVPMVSASSGLVQISGGLSSGVVTLSSVHTVTATAGTNPWSSAPGFNVPIVSVSSGLVQISGTVTLTSSGVTQVTGQSTNGMTPFSYVSSSSNNSNNVNSGNTAFHGYAVFNTTVAQRYMKIYATSSAPTVGSTANFQMTLGIPGSTAGAGANMVSPLDPLFYSTRGLAFTITANPPTTDTGTIGNNDLVVNLFYKTA